MNTIKKLTILILTLTILFYIIFITQSAEMIYPFLNNENIKNHSEQAIIPFPWEPILSMNFTRIPYSGSAPFTVKFINTSINSPTSWNWSNNETNLLAYSQDFNVDWSEDSSYWTVYKTRLEPADIPAPDGSMSAWKMIADNTEGELGGNDHNIDQAYTPLSNTIYTFSVYLKPAGDPWAMLTIRGYENTWRNGYFDITNGTVGNTYNDGTLNSTNSLILSISPAKNGWYRCIETFNSSSGAVSPFLVYIFEAKDNGECQFTGDNSSGIYMWGAQLEQGSMATPFVKTTTGNIVYFRTSQKLV